MRHVLAAIGAGLGFFINRFAARRARERFDLVLVSIVGVGRLPIAVELIVFEIVVANHPCTLDGQSSTGNHRQSRPIITPELRENVTDPNNPHEPPCPPSFEQALVQLEQIVRQLEDGEVGLAESLAHYEQGVKLLKQCYGLLQHAERRIELVSGVDAEGNPVTQPFDDESTLALEEKAQPRNRRRIKRPEAPKGGAPAPKSPQDEDEIDTLGSLF